MLNLHTSHNPQTVLRERVRMFDTQTWYQMTLSGIGNRDLL